MSGLISFLRRIFAVPPVPEYDDMGHVEVRVISVERRLKNLQDRLDVIRPEGR